MTSVLFTHAIRTRWEIKRLGARYNELSQAIAHAERDSDFDSGPVLYGLKTELNRATDECFWARRVVSDLCRAVLVQRRSASFDEEQLQERIDEMERFWRRRGSEPEYFRELWRTIRRWNTG